MDSRTPDDRGGFVLRPDVPRRARLTLVTVLAAALAGSMVTGVPARATPPPGPKHLSAQVEKLDTVGGEARGKAWPVRRQVTKPAPAPAWPKAGPVTLTTARSAGTPVWIRPEKGAAATATPQLPAQVLDRTTLPAAWRAGVVLRLGASGSGSAGATTLAGTGPVWLSVDYSGFRYAYGANWAQRLKMWLLPECALSTPDLVGCSAAPLPSVNNTSERTVTAELTGGTSTTLVALASGSSGSGGDFGASPLQASSTWSVGGPSGDFSWSYPMRMVPDGQGGAPEVGITYSSSSVDGRNEASNNQPSWIGEGFDYWPGYIERSYVPCQDDKTNGNNTKDNGDQCWRNENATMNLGGAGSEMVFETGKGWHSRNEDGAKIEKLTGAGNGDNDGEYWKVTTTDGTQYFFGRNRPGGQTSDTNSTWTVPVFGNQTGEPCHATAFLDSDCQQAWRWNLDYVVDTYGNTTSYWYTKEFNQYAQDATDANNISYVRGGTLARIEYGTWYRGATDYAVNPTAKVVFTPGDRCFTNCYTGTPPAPNKANWYDTPWDQECKSDSTSCPKNYSPTFWSTQRLSKITTWVWDTTKPTPGWQDVESWTLNQSFPPTGDGSDHPGLWLDSIVHEGLVGTKITMPPVSFTPISLPNRVLTPTNTTNNWQRIDTITTETGSLVNVDYSLPECSGSTPAVPETNTKRCYPAIIADPADPTGKTLKTEWWHKYLVAQVSESDLQMADGHQGPTEYTYYQYGGTPSWHYADDDGLTKPNRRTWNQYRGFSTVTTRTGDVPGQQTLTTTTYLRGMNGDRLNASGGTKSVTVAASIGSETVYDEDQFSGMVREQTVYNGVDTKPVSRIVNVPWRSPATATRTVNNSTVTARFVNTRIAYTAKALGVDGARGWRTQRTENSFDDTYGTTTWTQEDGEPATGDETCVTNTYNRNLTKNLTGTLKRTTTTGLRCGVAPTLPEHVLADTRLTYDGASSPDTAPDHGTVSKTEQMKDWTATTGTQWLTTNGSSVDVFGRTETVTDVRGNTTATTYSPAAGPVTSTVETVGPYDWSTTTQFAPYWPDAPTKITDTNDRVTDAEYDALGRTSKVWKVGWSKGTNKDTPSVSYTYNYSPDRSAYPYKQTTTLNAAGGLNTMYEISDALLRPRQTQHAGVGGGRVVTDTLYDRNGRAETTHANHLEPGTASGTLWWEPEWSVPSVTRTVYDNASRATTQVLLAGDGQSQLVEKWRTTTAYEGDMTKVTPPAGGTPTTTLTDTQERVTEVRQHTTSSGVNGAYNAISYTYDARDKLKKVVDPAGNEWTWTFDLRGRMASAKDPDRGTTLTEYNDYNEPTKVTDANQKALVTIYDAIGRKAELREDSETGPLRAKWNYDRLYTGQIVSGQLTESIRYEPAGSTNAYKWQVRSFSTRYQPNGVNVVIPSVEGSGLANTWVYGYGYSGYDGSATTFTYPAGGGLAGETVTATYDSTTGLPNALNTNLPGVGSYVAGQQYTAFGEPTVTTRQVSGGAYVENGIEYDPATRRVKRLTVKPETAAGTIVDRTYSHDFAGNIISIADVPEVGQADTQCFSYDTLRRLTSAWTPRAGVTCGTAPAVANLGGPAPYWLDWTIDNVGNRLSETSHASNGNTTRTYTVPTGGATAVRPHAMTAVTTAPPGQTAVTTRYSYDNTGNTACRPAGATANTCPTGTGSQVLAWDPEGHLAAVASGGSTVETNIYDAEGARLVRRDSTGTTVQMPGMELRKQGTTTTATRYYTFGGGTVASRTPATLSWLFSDHQGTQYLSVDAATQQATQRRQTPYGTPRGTQPTWPNPRGYVGGTNDPTGLVHIGAREYDAGIGRFISVDPVMDLKDIQQINGYSYSSNSPVTFSDPTGLRQCGDDRCLMYEVVLSKPGAKHKKVKIVDRRPRNSPDRLSPRAKKLRSIKLMGRSLTKREYENMRDTFGYTGSYDFTIGDAMDLVNCQKAGGCNHFAYGYNPLYLAFDRLACDAMGGMDCYKDDEGAFTKTIDALRGVKAIGIPAEVLDAMESYSQGRYKEGTKHVGEVLTAIPGYGEYLGKPAAYMVASQLKDRQQTVVRPGTKVWTVAGSGTLQFHAPDRPGTLNWEQGEVLFPMPLAFIYQDPKDPTFVGDLRQAGFIS